MMSDEALLVALCDVITIATDDSASPQAKQYALTWARKLIDSLPIEAIKKTLNPS